MTKYYYLQIEGMAKIEGPIKQPDGEKIDHLTVWIHDPLPRRLDFILHLN